MNFIQKNLKRLYHATCGIFYALRNDFSYRWQVVAGGIVVLFLSYYLWPLTKSEMLFLGLGWTLILITELQNSSFEAALDRLHPERHDDIGRSKDMAAGAVLTAGIFFLFVVVMIVGDRLL